MNFIRVICQQPSANYCNLQRAQVNSASYRQQNG